MKVELKVQNGSVNTLKDEILAHSKENVYRSE